MFLMSSTCFQLGPSTAPGMAHGPLATARAPGKGNGGKRLSWAQICMWELHGGPIPSFGLHLFILGFIYSTKSFNKQSFTSHLFILQIFIPRGKSFMVAAKSFIQQSHSFIHCTFQFLPLQIQTLQGTLASWRTVEKTSEQLVETHSPGGSLFPQNQPCPSPTLGIAGVILPPPSAPLPASPKSGFRQLGLPAISQPRF